MTLKRAEIWKKYMFKGEEVMVVQQWRDPFGRPMLRIESTKPDDDRGDGMLEAFFLSAAYPVEDTDKEAR
jgi:hypothetical protein